MMKMMKKLNPSLIVLLAAAILLLPLTACDRDDGPMEEMGESLDDAVDDLKDSVEEAGDDLEDAAEDLEDAAEELGDDLEEAVDGDGDQ